MFANNLNYQCFAIQAGAEKLRDMTPEEYAKDAYDILMLNVNQVMS